MLTATIGELKEHLEFDGKEKVNRNKVNNTIKNTRTLTIAELKKQAEENYQAKVAREESLINAYKEKKIKSKSLIKEAKSLIATKEKEPVKEV